MTLRTCALRFFGIAAALLIPVSPMLAQNFPGKVHIYNAAQQMNAITPQAVAQQTIEIGVYNGSTNTFQFLIEPSYPPNIPAYRWVENGGNVPPRYAPLINSYNVKYEFRIVDKPPGFGITVELPEADGSMVKKEATITGGGTRASVTFNPKSFRAQVITIRRPGGDTTVRVFPILQPQLGAFVVPHQLITIVYEPPGLGPVPGTGSTSTFAQTSTANTVMTWDFARTSGLVETMTTGGMYDMFGQAMGMGAGAILGQASDKAMLQALKAAAEGGEAGAKAAKAAGKQSQSIAGAVPILAVVNVIIDLAEQSEITTTTTQTTGTTTTQGISISVTADYTTKLHQYPGAGDLFVVLHDVLYAYLAHAGKVYLAPIAYSGVGYYSAPELRQKLPAVAEQYIALDPHLRTPPMYPATPKAQMVGRGQMLPRADYDRVPIAAEPFSARFVPFGPYQHVECKASGSPGITLKREDFQSTAVTHTKTTTVVEHITGLGALIGGGGDRVQGTTYSTAMQQGTSQEQSTSIKLDCGSADQFMVDVYLDRTFRTFLTLRGEPIDTTHAIAGVAQRPDGSRAARQLVRLRIGGETYVTQSDDNGNFRFSSRALPQGAGQIQVGNEQYNVRYAGAPKNLMLRGGVVAEIPAAGAPSPAGPLGTTRGATQPKSLPTTAVPRKPTATRP